MSIAMTMRAPAVVALAAALMTLPTTASAGIAIKDKVRVAIPQIEKLAQSIVSNGGVPGLAIAIVYKDETIYLKGFGVREAGKPGGVDADTVFQLASLSKPLSATVVAALVSDGKVSWDSRVSDLDPAFKLHGPYPTEQVTLTDLFSHRSGLPGDAGNDLENFGFDRATILHRLRYVSPASSFRSTYAYSNFGLTEGAVAAARPTGKTWEEVAEQKLYKPLGMTATSSRHADFLKQANRAALHVRVQDKWTALVKRDPDPQSPAGGASSNVRDLAQWVRLELANGKLNGKQLITEAALAETHVPLIMSGRDPFTGRPRFYGRGWGYEFRDYGIVWTHAGAFSKGARTVASLVPGEDLGIVVLANAFPTGAPEGVAETFFDLVFKGKVSRDWTKAWTELYTKAFGAPAIAAAIAPFAKRPAKPSPAMAAAAYIGDYRNDYVGTVSVSEKDGALQLLIGPAKQTYRLTHFDRDLFLYTPFSETPEWVVPVVFTVGPDQKAGVVMIANFAENGQGRLERVRK